MFGAFFAWRTGRILLANESTFSVFWSLDPPFRCWTQLLAAVQKTCALQLFIPNSTRATGGSVWTVYCIAEGGCRLQGNASTFFVNRSLNLRHYWYKMVGLCEDRWSLFSYALFWFLGAFLANIDILQYHMDPSTNGCSSDRYWTSHRINDSNLKPKLPPSSSWQGSQNDVLSSVQCFAFPMCEKWGYHQSDSNY